MQLPFDLLLTRILVSIGLGALIGVEREIRNSPAGLRTISLVALGSTLFTLASLEFAGPGADISRIASQIVVGIGFLGAGVIFKANDQVHGLTTAASLWVTAALGLFVGLGEYQLSFMVAIAVLIILWFGHLEKKLLPHEKLPKK